MKSLRVFFLHFSLSPGFNGNAPTDGTSKWTFLKYDLSVLRVEDVGTNTVDYCILVAVHLVHIPEIPLPNPSNLIHPDLQWNSTLHGV